VKCHVCDLDATVQWQRYGTDDETTQYMAGLNEQLKAHMYYQRAMGQLNVAQLQQQHAELIALHTLEGDQAAAMLAGQIGKHEAEMESAGPVIAPDLSHQLPITVAVFACDIHAIPEDERCVIQPATEASTV
jgi:hypothetical protein